MKQRLVPFYLFACLLAGTSNCTHTAGDKTSPPSSSAQMDSASFSAFEQRFLSALWQIDPEWALSAGYYAHIDQVTIPDEAHRRRYRDFCQAMEKELKAFALTELKASQQTDWWLIHDFLAETQWRLETFQSHVWNPSVFNLSPSIARLFEAQSLQNEQRFRAASRRFATAAAYYEAARSSLKDPTLEHTQLALLQHASMPAYWQKSYATTLESSQLTRAEKQEFQANLKAAIAAVETHIDWLKKLESRLQAQGARSFRLQPAIYRQKFMHELGAASAPEEIYAKALAAKETTLQKMDALATELYPRYRKGPLPAERLKRIQEVVGELSRKHPEPQALRQAIEAQIPALERFVRAKDLVYLDPNKPLVVRDTPLYARGVAGASIDAPGPYDSGGETYYNVTPLDAYSREKALSYLREYNDYTLQILNIHEAIPGHYTQLLYANRSPSLIKSLLGNGTMIEGWAVYAERMMLEEGYGQSPELWLMYYKWHMRVILNTVLDYEVHNKNLDREAGIALLRDQGFQEQAEAEEKWKRATLSQVQLASYFTGYSEIYSLREEIKSKAGSQFKLREFHDQFLAHGSAPVKYIRELLLKNPSAPTTH